MSGGRHLVLRVTWLYFGLVGFGVSLALRLKVPIGWVVVGMSFVVLAAWAPLRQRPGFGTLSNAVVVGLVVNLALEVVPAPPSLLLRVGMMAGAIVGNGLATALYIGAGLGPGPRDGLMTGMAARGHSVRVTRTAIEISVLLMGIVLGGTIGVGTVAYAVSIGPLAHFFLPRLSLVAHTGSAPANDSSADKRRPCWTV